MYSRTDYRLRGEFFSGIDARAYFDRIYDKIKSVLSDLGILSQDLQDLTNYFVSKYSLELITVFETNIQRDLYEIKVKRREILSVDIRMKMIILKWMKYVLHLRFFSMETLFFCMHLGTECSFSFK